MGGELDVLQIFETSYCELRTSFSEYDVFQIRSTVVESECDVPSSKCEVQFSKSGYQVPCSRYDF
jgi:hypothetical protein